MCLSLELQQTECALKHNVNNHYVRVDRGHILIVHGLISSYHTPLLFLVVLFISSAERQSKYSWKFSAPSCGFSEYSLLAAMLSKCFACRGCLSVTWKAEKWKSLFLQLGAAYSLLLLILIHTKNYKHVRLCWCWLKLSRRCRAFSSSMLDQLFPHVAVSVLQLLLSNQLTLDNIWWIPGRNYC